MSLKKIIKAVVICFVLSLLLECSLFNIKVYTTHNYKSKDLTDKITLHGLSINKKGIVKIKDFNNNYIEIKNVNSKIKNLKLDFSNISSNYLIYKATANDEANSEYLNLPTRYLYPYIEKSKYLTFNLDGKSDKIKISFLKIVPNYGKIDGISFKLNSISINEKVPFDFSITRFILTFSVLCLIYFFRPKSGFYKEKVDFKNKYQIGILAFSVLVIGFIYFYVVNINTVMKNPYVNSNYTQYYDLVKSFTHGKLYLEEKPSSLLLNMNNPYDFTERKILQDKYGGFFRWDNALYKGKYYVYFGVVPVVTALLPYYLITGEDLPIYILTFVVIMMAVVGMLLLLKEVTKRYFKNIPFLLFVLLFIFLSISLIEIAEYPSVYNLPIAFAIMFIYLGLYFMMSSIGKDKINTIRIFFGSLCLALVAGCRPQLLVSSFLLIPLFWKSVFKDRTLFSKKSIKQTIAFLLPYVVVAIFIMAYNYLRFGSVFEFGVNYNVTVADMTKRGFTVGRIGFGVFLLLFQLPVTKLVFPFISEVVYLRNYMGRTIYENSFGGLFATNLILVSSLFIKKFKKYLPKDLYKFSIMSVIFAFLILIFDIEASGALPRYIPDFSWLLYLPTIFIIMGVFNSKIDKNIKRVILTFVVILIFINLSYQFLTIFDDKFVHDMITINTAFYFKWYYLLQWWL